MLKVSGKPREEHSGTQALLEAMSNDQMHLARFILDALDGKIVNTRGGDLSRTPLICSALLPEPRSRQKYMQLLLEKGAEVNSRDRAGRTALSYSCERGHLQEVKILVQHGADPELSDLWGNTALIYASVSGHAPVLDFLARAFKRLGLQIDRANRVGNSALDVARYLGYKDCEVVLCGGTLGRMNDTHEPSACPCNEQQQTTTRAHSFLLGRSRSLAIHRHLESMDSIEEEDGDKGNSATGSLGFSNVLNPRPRSFSLQYGGRSGERKGTGLYLPALSSASIQISTNLYSPRPGKQHEPTLAPLPGPLGILLTPLSANPPTKHLGAKDHLPGCSKDTGLCRFNDTYYQKRSSLPSTLLTPTPPDREQLGSRTKSSGTSLPPVSSSNPFTVLGNKLFRRFTFPEFKKQQPTETGGNKSHDKDVDTKDAKDPGCRGIARSETFPVCKTHPRVVSKPSVDSISSVKCEFDFQQQSGS